MGEACGTCGGKVEVHYRVWWGNLRERNPLKNLGVDGNKTLKHKFNK